MVLLLSSSSVIKLSLFLATVMKSVRTKTEVNHCKLSSAADDTCKQECNKDCDMTCSKAKSPLKSCDQECWSGRCDMRCVTKETCHQTCESFVKCSGSIFCKTSNCTQNCDVGACDMSCRSSSHCKQICNEGSCKLKCPKTGDHCKQVSSCEIASWTFKVENRVVNILKLSWFNDNCSERTYKVTWSNPLLA